MPYLLHSTKQEFLILGNAAAYDIPVDTMYLRDQLPTKNGIITENIVSEFQKSLYGFKPHAIQRAIDSGYKKIIWLDPSALPTVLMQVLIDSLDEHPMIVRIGDNPLSKMCNKKALAWFETDELEIRNEKHIGGTVYAFNFNDPKTVEVFNSWKMAEENGIFGTQDDFMAGHWADEACMALAMWEHGMPQYWEEKFTYLNQKEL